MSGPLQDLSTSSSGILSATASAPPAGKPTNAWTAFWRSVVRFQSDKVAPWLALRNTLGVVLPLAMGVATGEVSSGLVAGTGALNVAFSDSDEPYAQRARRMLAASALVGLAVFAGSLTGASPMIAVSVDAAWAFAAGMMVALSTTAADLGAVSLVTLVVFAAVPQPPERAMFAGLLAFGGGLLQTLLAVIVWPLYRYLPERRVLGELYLELARAAALPVRVMEAPPASAQTTQAQQRLAALDRDHSIPSERYRLLLSQAERIRLSLLALGRLRARMEREQPGSATASIVERYFEVSARVGMRSWRVKRPSRGPSIWKSSRHWRKRCGTRARRIPRRWQPGRETRGCRWTHWPGNCARPSIWRSTRRRPVWWHSSGVKHGSHGVSG
jgi:hypothetical protein